MVVVGLCDSNPLCQQFPTFARFTMAMRPSRFGSLYHDPVLGIRSSNHSITTTLPTPPPQDRLCLNLGFLVHQRSAHPLFIMATQVDPDDYNSAADSDFDASLSPSSGSDSEHGTTKGQKRKAEEVIDSGDEKIVKEGVKKRRKKKKGSEGKAGEEEEEERVVLRVRTRCGRGG